MTTGFNTICFRRVPVNGFDIHFQEAIDPSAPHIAWLHGFPSTSQMWERLIPASATKYRIIAPDYPGLGLS